MERTAVEGKRVPKPKKCWSPPSPPQKKKKISKRAAARSVSGRRGERSRSGRGRADEQQIVAPVPPRPRSRPAKRRSGSERRVVAPRASSARGGNRKRARSPPSRAAKRAPVRRQSSPEEGESEESEMDSEQEMEDEEVEPQPMARSLTPRPESPTENPEAPPPSGETSEAESEDKEDEKNQTDSQMKEDEEEEEERDTSSRAETEESSSKKVSPDRPSTSIQNAPESRSPSAESEQTATTPELNSSNSTTSSIQTPEAMEHEKEAPEVSTPPSTPRQARRLDNLNPATLPSSSRAVSEELEEEFANAPIAEENKENVEETSCRRVAENSEAMEQEEEVDMPPPARLPRLEQSKNIPSTSSPNAQRAEEPTTSELSSTPASRRVTPEVIEQEEQVDMPPPVLISSPPPTRRLTRLLAKSNQVEPIPMPVTKKPLSSSKKQTEDVQSTSSQSDSDRPFTTSSQNAPRTQQQVDKENVPTTSSAATANPSKFACCTLNATILPYNAGNLRCENHPDCRIPPDAEFWELEGSATETFYCLKCFEEKKPKGKFEKKTNDNDEVEPILECKKCRMSFHLCCSFYYEEDLTKFVCESCSGIRIKKTITGVEKCPLGAYMTKKMMDFLASRLGVVEYPIRICGFSEAKSAKASTVVPPVLMSQFVKKHSRTINYVSRALHVYQRVDDVDVITFAIYTAEYEYRGGEEKWCIIDYIDSLPYFEKFDGVQKKEIHNLLIHTYYEYMGGLGYKNGHLWSNPPQKGDDYVFNIHPFDQPFLNPTGLIGWYQRLLKDGQDKKILAGFKNFKDAGFQKVADIPVFVGSLWSTVFKETTKPTNMKKFESELEEKKAKHAEDNFFIEIAAPKSPQPPQATHNTHEILGDRVKLLELCVDKNWQFEDIRRAKYSSVALIRMMDE